MAIFELVLAGRVLPPPLASDPAGSHTGKQDRMPRTEFYCFHVIGAPKLLFSVQSIWCKGRGKCLLEPDTKPKGVGARVLGMP